MRRLSHHFSIVRAKFASFPASVRAVWAGLAFLSALSIVTGSAASAADAGSGEIPEDAIRIRILAHSDSSFDQQVKQAVRKRVEREIVSWGPMPDTYSEARALIESRMDDIQAAADLALAEWDVSYGVTVQLGETPFPEKMFRGRAYEAGAYEALRISLGGGEGANWWCVLFPPLCLTAATASEEEAPKQAVGGAGTGGQKAVHTGAVAPSAADQADGDESAGERGEDHGSGGKPKAKFFLAEIANKLGDFLRSLFS